MIYIDIVADEFFIVGDHDDLMAELANILAGIIRTEKLSTDDLIIAVKGAAAMIKQEE